MDKQEEREYTPEEIKTIKEGMLKRWEEEIPFLQKKVEYERLITELDELYMRRVYAMQKAGDILSQKLPQDDNIVPKHERKLRKEPV